MDNIIEPSPDFNFTKVTCSPPNNIGGSYFTRLFYNNKPMYIQTPKSLTKQGIIKGKKINYSDTLFIQWIEDLEEKCRGLIQENSTKWFETSLDKGDIEEAFNSIIKIYKSGKNYLIRTNIKENVRIYDDLNNNIEQYNLKNTNYLISILEFQGIKFTTRNFQILIEMKQAMIVSPDPFLDECFIKTPFKSKRKVGIDIDIEETKNSNKEISFDNTNTNTLEENNRLNLEKSSSNLKLNDNDFDIDIDVDEEEETNICLEENTNLKKSNMDMSVIDDFPKEYEMEMPTLENSITLKNHNQVYYELYKKARDKAKKAKKESMLAYLEAKELKNTHILDLTDEDSDSDIEYNLNILS